MYSLFLVSQYILIKLSDELLEDQSSRLLCEPIFVNEHTLLISNTEV